MSILENKAIKDFIRTCNDGWEQGWHERNGGNLTYRMTEAEVAACTPYFNSERGEFIPLGVTAENLGGAYFITTGSGKYFRHVASDPQHTIGVVEINEGGNAYRTVWGLKDARPTSEFPSHFMNHSVRVTATDGACRVIYHAHPANIIAMTYTLPLTARDFTLALWRSATECPVVFPAGVGVVPWMVPGGAEIALATSRVMQEYDAAIWAHHGLFCSGADFDTTFGLMHTIEKAAEIYNLVQSTANGKVLQTITNENLLAIAKEFGVTLRASFLD